MKRQRYASRGAVEVRRSTPYYKDKKKRRELIPKYNKWGDQNHQGIKGANTFAFSQIPNIRKGHIALRKANPAGKNYRRTLHPIKQKRGYWDKTVERKREHL